MYCLSASPVENGKAVLVHLRETGGKEASLDLKNGLTGNPLKISGADVTGKSVQDAGNTSDPLNQNSF